MFIILSLKQHILYKKLDNALNVVHLFQSVIYVQMNRFVHNVTIINLSLSFKKNYFLFFILFLFFVKNLL